MENASQNKLKYQKLILEKVQNLDIDEDFLLSKYLSKQLNKEYSNISKIFSNRKHYFRTIFYSSKNRKSKRTFDLSKIELTLSQIADKLGLQNGSASVSTIQKTTGFSPSQFQELKEKRDFRLILFSSLFIFTTCCTF